MLWIGWWPEVHLDCLHEGWRRSLRLWGLEVLLQEDWLVLRQGGRLTQPGPRCHCPCIHLLVSCAVIFCYHDFVYLICVLYVQFYSRRRYLCSHTCPGDLSTSMWVSTNNSTFPQHYSHVWWRIRVSQKFSPGKFCTFAKISGEFAKALKMNFFG